MIWISQTINKVISQKRQMEEKTTTFKIKRNKRQNKKYLSRRQKRSIEDYIKKYLLDKERKQRQNRPASLRALDETRSESSLLQSYQQSSSYTSSSQELWQQFQEPKIRTQLKYQEDFKSQCNKNNTITKSSSRQSLQQSQNAKVTLIEGSTKQIQNYNEKLQLTKKFFSSQNIQEDSQPINSINQNENENKNQIENHIAKQQHAKNSDDSDDSDDSSSGISDRFSKLSRIKKQEQFFYENDVDEKTALELQEQFELQGRFFYKNNYEGNNFSNNNSNKKLDDDRLSLKQIRAKQRQCACECCHKNFKQTQLNHQIKNTQFLKQQQKETTIMHKASSHNEKIQSNNQLKNPIKYLSQQTKSNVKEKQQFEKELILFNSASPKVKAKVDEFYCQSCNRKCYRSQNDKQRQIRSTQDFLQRKEQDQEEKHQKNQNQFQQIIQNICQQSDLSNAQTEIVTQKQFHSPQNNENKSQNLNFSHTELTPNTSKDQNKILTTLSQKQQQQNNENINIDIKIEFVQSQQYPEYIFQNDDQEMMQTNQASQ